MQHAVMTSAVMDALIALARELHHLPGIRHVEPGDIRGCAFFPGGTGILVGPDVHSSKPGRTIPVGGVLVLGHNFHDVKSYNQSVEFGDELYTPTWRNLARALAAFGIPHDICFFSNALMGLMDRAGACGTHDGHRDQAFRAGCIGLLSATLAVQRPRLVLALGKYAPPMLAEAVPGLGSWRRGWTFPAFDAARSYEAGLQTFLPGTDTPMPCVALTHPSQAHRNVWRRSVDDLRGSAAEIEMVRRTKRVCGLP
jgi:uracil-DNA glycosylase